MTQLGVNYLNMYRLKLLKAIIKNSFEHDMAYIANGWGNILSVIFYMLANIVFIDVIFQNVSSLAGYTRDEILLFNMLSQVWAFLLLGLLFSNLAAFIESVNNGELDLVLTKPVPSLLYIFLKEVSIVRILRDFIPSISILLIAIDWETIVILPSNLILGLLIMIAGLICSACFHFIAALPVFWLGDNSGITDLFIEVEDRSGHSNLVYEAWSDFWRVIFTIFIPTAISTAISTSVILGKSPGPEMLVIALMVMIVFILIVNILWRICLKNYTSASS